MRGQTVALVGATGGAGTTRTAVELATMLGRDGHSAVVLDAAFGTQGLSEYISGCIDPDLTTLLTDDPDRPLSDAGQEIAHALPGTVTLVPVRAPFERISRAKAASAARRLDSRIDEASEMAEFVIVDTPPTVSNEVVAVWTTVDEITAVTPASTHGRDALQRLRGRLQDVDTDVDSVISTGGRDAVGDAHLPDTALDVESAPVVGTGTTDYAAAVGSVAETILDIELDVEFESDSILDTLRS